MRSFIKDLKRNGFKYAVAVKYMFLYEKVNFKPLRDKLEQICDKMYDYAYNIDYPADRLEKESLEVKEYTDKTETSCGCRLFNDCRECNCYNMCH